MTINKNSSRDFSSVGYYLMSDYFNIYIKYEKNCQKVIGVGENNIRGRCNSI